MDTAILNDVLGGSRVRIPHLTSDTQILQHNIHEAAGGLDWFMGSVRTDRETDKRLSKQFSLRNWQIPNQNFKL